MYRVVIVDDEVLARMGLRSLLDWNQEGFEIVGEASNGKDGVQLILDTRPDVVIADIVMPGVDGLEMYSELKKNGFDPVFVVLSSYDQFDLVKKAMKMGALDYLLKLSISAESLRDMFAVIREKLKEKEKENINDQIQERTGWEVEELRTAFFESLLVGNTPQTDIEKLDICLNEDHLRVCYILSDMERIAGQKNDVERKIYIETLRTLIHEICEEFYPAYCIPWNYSYIIILSDDGVDGKDNENLRAMAEAIVLSLKEYGNVKASIGISNRIGSYDKIVEALETAKGVYQGFPVAGFGNVYLFGNDKEKSERIIKERNHAGRDKMAQTDVGELFETAALKLICQQRNKEDFWGLEHEMNRQILENCFSLSKAIYHSNRFICLTGEYLKQLDGGYYVSCEMEEELRMLVQKLYQSKTLKEVVECNNLFVQKTTQFFEQQSGADENHIVRKAKEYIKAHIYESVGLKEISAALFINPSYLSAVFSKQESCGLTNYINQVKIKEAMRLLAEEHRKIYEVSLDLGYENASYFAKVFRKYTGMSPKQYTDALKQKNR